MAPPPSRTEAIKVTEAVFTFVAVDDNGRPRAVSAPVTQEK
jgi:acyl-CoA hydrolase